MNSHTSIKYKGYCVKVEKVYSHKVSDTEEITLKIIASTDLSQD